MQMRTQATFVRGSAVVARPTAVRTNRATLVVTAAAANARPKVVFEEGTRFRLNNIGPATGSRRQETRKGRGYGAGQGATCGYGMRGQLSRSGHATRPGFEGGQIPLFRRLPKKKGICGGMGAGLPDNVVVNLTDLAEKFAEGDTVNLASIEGKRIFNLSGRESRLGLKILGDGELPFALTIQAEKFSKSALAKIEAAGGTCQTLPKKAKWTRKAAKAAGKSK